MSNDEDIRKYLPDLTTALQSSEEAAVAERRRRALDSRPDLTPTPPPLPAAPAAKVALPSSFAPSAGGAAAIPRPGPVTASTSPPAKKGSKWAMSVLAVVAVLAPVTVLWVVFQVKPPHGPAEGSSAAPIASAAPVASVAPPASASAEPVASAAPPASASAEPVASAEVDASAPTPLGSTTVAAPFPRSSGKPRVPGDAPTGDAPPVKPTKPTRTGPLPPEDF